MAFPAAFIGVLVLAPMVQRLTQKIVHIDQKRDNARQYSLKSALINAFLRMLGSQ